MNYQVGSLNSCINEPQQQAYIGITRRSTRINRISKRTKLVYKKNYRRKKKLLRDTQIRNVHELGEMKRDQELRVDEFSVQKLRESHDTIQGLTSQLQSMQEQMNSMNNSREFQDMESNHSGRLSRIPSQPAMVPSSSFMLSRFKRLPFDTWNSLGLQENVFGNQFSTFGSHRNPSQGIHFCATPRETESVLRAIGTGTSFARDDEQNEGTIPMPTCARRPSTMSSLTPVDIPQNSIWLDGKDSEDRSGSSTNCQLHNRLWCGKFDSRIK